MAGGDDGNSRHSRRKWPALVLCLGLLFLVVLGLAINRARYGGDYVMVRVEESSTLALKTWPVLSEDPAEAWPDPETRTLQIARGKMPWSAVMAVHYSANSLGVRFYDHISFSRTGRMRLGLSRALSWVVPGENGESVEAVDNHARVLLGDLFFEGCTPDGKVAFKYGPTRVELAPGERWATLLVLDGARIREVDGDSWREELEDAMVRGCPATRVMVTNMGLWPRDQVITAEEGGYAW